MAGRPPKAAALHLIKGRAGAATRAKAEPVAPGRLTDAPEWLSRAQKAHWRYAIANAPYALLRKIDRQLLAVWAVAVDTHQKAARALMDGVLLTQSPSGHSQARPEISIMNRQALVMIRAAIELGFTPTARARIGIAQARTPSESGEENEDPAEEFFRRA